jgi:hypothetical protein
LKKGAFLVLLACKKEYVGNTAESQAKKVQSTTEGRILYRFCILDQEPAKQLKFMALPALSFVMAS